MKYEPWQERVIEEEKELKTKLTALRVFLSGEAVKKLPVIDQMLLENQELGMSIYLTVLMRRIARFTD